MTPKICPYCEATYFFEGDHRESDFKKEEPPRRGAVVPRINLHDYDSTPRRQMQEATSRAMHRNAYYDFDCR